MISTQPNDPIRARLAKTERRRVALSAMLNRLAKGADIAEELLTHETPEIRLRAVHALNQCVSTYAKVYEVGELEYRFEMLEQWAREQAPTSGLLPDPTMCNVAHNDPEEPTP